MNTIHSDKQVRFEPANAEAIKLLSADSWNWKILPVRFSGLLSVQYTLIVNCLLKIRGVQLSLADVIPGERSISFIVESLSIFAIFNINLLCSDWWR